MFHLHIVTLEIKFYYFLYLRLLICIIKLSDRTVRLFDQRLVLVSHQHARLKVSKLVDQLQIHLHEINYNSVKLIAESLNVSSRSRGGGSLGSVRALRPAVSVSGKSGTAQSRLAEGVGHTPGPGASRVATRRWRMAAP